VPAAPKARPAAAKFWNGELPEEEARKYEAVLKEVV
jgi:hypothetical protein